MQRYTASRSEMESAWSDRYNQDMSKQSPEVVEQEFFAMAKPTITSISNSPKSELHRQRFESTQDEAGPPAQ